MDILVKNMELTQLMDIFNEAGVRYYKNGEPIEFEIFHNDEDAMKPLYERFIAARGLRIKRIVDDAVEHTREELYETFDLKEQEHEK